MRRRVPAALFAVWALAACDADFSGAACATCTPDAAGPGRPDAAPPDVDLCAGVVCSDPPADGCEGEMVAVYPAEGECDPATGECVYTPALTACDQP
ncbi:MAG TPA: hypothetical protein VFU21_05175, partial [Kofleriaceae bacterium]|nr:hypothetical protein [Kofleriaceae bacterium]